MRENMNTKIVWSLFAALMFSILAFPSLAQNLAPDALIKDLYKIHGQDSRTGKDRIINGRSRTYLDKYFAKNLADLIWKDMTTHTDDVGVIDFDVFYNTQDPEIKNLSVGAAKISGSRATVTVKFTNADVKETLIYHLVKQSAGWKIVDISYGEGASLLGFFKEDAKR
jgi:hypothetical protein